MAATPTFDYLTIINNQNGPSLAKYIVKSRSINFTYDVNTLESYRKMTGPILKYLDGLIRGPKESAEPAINQDKKLIQFNPKIKTNIYLLQIYADSITIRSNYRAQRITLPLRSNLTNNQLTKIPFVNISNLFKDNELHDFLVELDKVATEVALQA